MIFDTHAHYDDSRFDADRFALLSALPSAGVGGVIVPSTDPENLETVLMLAEEVAYIHAAVGFHPHSAEEIAESDFAALQQCLQNPAGRKIAAIGECGLDYHYNIAPKEVQKEVFARHLALAQATGLPVIVHDREAHADCLDLIRRYPGVRGVFHCYSGSAEMVREVIGLDFMISFTGSVTFKNAHRLRQAAALVPDDRLMVETDAPYMAPEPFRGKRCDSRMIAQTLEILAGIRGCSREDLEQLAWENALNFFKISPFSS